MESSALISSVSGADMMTALASWKSLLIIFSQFVGFSTGCVACYKFYSIGSPKNPNGSGWSVFALFVVAALLFHIEKTITVLHNTIPSVFPSISG